MKRSLQVLLLCDYRLINAATIIDHINALYEYSEADIHPFNPVLYHGMLPDWVPLDSFDVVVVHYSLYLLGDAYLSEKSKQKLAGYEGLKALFIQDEYRTVDLIAQEVARCGITLVFTCLDDSVANPIYKRYAPNVRCIRVLTGYVPEKLKLYRPKPIKERSTHVFYRGREYPPYHGRFGSEKSEIGRRFKKYTKGSRLRYNISSSESRRLYGLSYTEALRSSRATLAVESGCSTFDETGRVFSACDMILQLAGKKQRKDAEKLCEELYLDSLDLRPIAQISPRCFEAIALGTLLILYEGDYSGVLSPWKHYVPLKKDFSNVKEVVSVLKDDNACISIIATAYAEIACNPQYSYKHLASIFDTHILKSLDINRGSLPEGDSDIKAFILRRGPFKAVNAHSQLINNGKLPLILKSPSLLIKASARKIAKCLGVRIKQLGF